MKRLIGITLFAAAVGAVLAGPVASTPSRSSGANASALPIWFGPARRMDLAAKGKLTVREFGCVAYDEHRESDRPIRFVVNSSAAKRKARAIIKRQKAASMTSLSVAKPKYSLESMLRLAISINAAKPEPTGTEQSWMYGASLQSNEFDGTGCPRIVISLVSTPTKTISDQTRAWANGEVLRYGSSKAFVREGTTPLEGPTLPL